MHLAIYAHPFDLDALAAHGGLPRLRELGFAEIALATAYHAGRWLQPWHPAGRVRFLEDGTVHFRPRADYGLLRPLPSSCVPANGPSPLERLGAEAPRAGLAVRAWAVLTHNSRLSALHPELCVENAFGDRYRYALCPAQPAVEQYVATLARDLAAHGGLGTIEYEAIGQLGWRHGSHHDKASFSPTGLLDAALSVCFCTACRAALAALGEDAEVTRRAVAARIDAWLCHGDAMAPAKVPQGPEPAAARPAELPGELVALAAWLRPVLEVRVATAAKLAAATRTSVPRAIQVHPHPWFTGSQLAAPCAEPFGTAAELVLTCYGDGPDTIARQLAALGPSGGAARRLSIWPKAPQFTRDEDLVKIRELCAAHGVASVAIYHLGLLPWRTIERVAKILRS